MYSPCQTAEADIGMLYYVSGPSCTGGRLKQEAADFIVREISSRPRQADDGRFSIAEVTSENWETNRLVRLMAKQLGISRDRIGFAGTKDKKAVTTQLMSFQCPPEALSRINLQDVSVSAPYTSRRRIQIGDLVGNGFEIRVRDTDITGKELEDTVSQVTADIRAAGGYPNYFGVQRFGVVRPVTHKVGELIVRGDFEGAVRCYVCDSPVVDTGSEADRMRAVLRDADDWGPFASRMPDFMGFEQTLVSYLADNPCDWAGAVRALPSNLQMMFVHAYQSYLFNLILSERIARGLPLDMPVEGDIVVPSDADGNPSHVEPVLVTGRNIDLAERQIRLGRGYVTHVLYGSDGISARGEPGEIEHSVIDRTGIAPEDFRIPEVPHCSSTGTRREILCPVGRME